MQPQQTQQVQQRQQQYVQQQQYMQQQQYVQQQQFVQQQPMHPQYMQQQQYMQQHTQQPVQQPVMYRHPQAIVDAGKQGLQMQGAPLQPVVEERKPQSGYPPHPHQSYAISKRASSASLLKSLPPELESQGSMVRRMSIPVAQQPAMSPILSQTSQGSLHATPVLSQPAMALSPLTSAKGVPVLPPPPAPTPVSDRPPLPKPPVIQGVPYQSHVLKGYGAPRPETGPDAPDYQYIDGTQGKHGHLHAVTRLLDKSHKLVRYNSVIK